MTVKLVQAQEFGAKWLAYQEKRQQHPELYPLFKTGISKLDWTINGGLERGQFMVVGGQPGGGKTTLLNEMMLAWAKQNLHVLLASAEMTTMQMGNMVFANMSGVDRGVVRRIEQTSEMWDLLYHAGEEIAKFDAWWAHGFSTMQDVAQMIEDAEQLAGRRLDIIVLDYVQLMNDDSPGNRVDQLSNITRSMKIRAIEDEKEMVFVAAAQVNRTSSRAKQLDLFSFLGSSGFERDSDIALMIKPEEDPSTGKPYPNRKILSVVKSRESGIGDPDGIRLYHVGGLARLKEETPPDRDMRDF